MEFQNLSKFSSTNSPKSSKAGRPYKADVILAKLSGLDEKFNDFTRELISMERRGININPLFTKLEEIIKTVEESKSKLKQGGKAGVKKDS
jgi:hypothetical protein